MKKNFWKHSIETPLVIVRGGRIAPELRMALEGMLTSLNASLAGRRAMLEEVLNPPRSVSDMPAFEQHCGLALYHHVAESARHVALGRRTEIITSQILPHITGGSLLDVGCGDGSVAWSVRDHVERIVAVDVVDYVAPNIRRSINFHRFSAGASLPVKEVFDTTLLITVLHHADNPLQLLKSVLPHTRRLIVIESVFLDDPTRQIYSGLPARSKPDQLAFAVFADWFYNRVVHRHVPVPFNFTTPEHWVDVLNRLGFEPIAQQELGVDIALVPEFHYLICAERRR